MALEEKHAAASNGGGAGEEADGNGNRNDGAGSSSSAMIVFAPSLAKQLGTVVRLPPNYVGVRRVRPSNRFVAQQQQQGGGGGSNSSNEAAARIAEQQKMVFKVMDPVTGRERRMSSKEKRQVKFQWKQQEKQRRLEAKLRQESVDDAVLGDDHDGVQGEGGGGEEADDDDNVRGEASKEEEGSDKKAKGSDAASDRYVNLPVDPERLAEELADLRGERDGVPPVVLPPSLCQLVLPNAAGNHQHEQLQVILDDELARTWAVALKESMAAAEDTRRAEEGLRPMPYHLVPEEWKRMRPSQIGSGSINKTDDGRSKVVAEDIDQQLQEPESWAFCQIRPPTPKFDSVAAAVMQVLHRGTGLHLSCGAKFGCDYLLYDGPRHERHAFAGLRVLTTTTTTTTDALPLPAAYDLSGYVRCLNTAGKLALLATVVHDEHGWSRVAIVDLALEKIAVTTSRRPQKTMEQRLQNLAKTQMIIN